MWKRLVLFTLIALLISFPFYQALADVYASNIRFTNPDGITPFDGSFADRTGVRIWFTLNDSASVVEVKIRPATAPTYVKTITAYNLKLGDNSVYWDGTNDSGVPVPAGNWIVEITARQLRGYTAWTQVWENPVYTGGGIGLSNRDIDVNKDPNSKNFGFIYITESTTTYQYNRMIKVSAYGSLIAEFDRSPTFINSNFDPWHLAIARDGRTYVTYNTLRQIRVYSDVVLVDSFSIPFAPRGINVYDTVIFVTGDKYIYRIGKVGKTILSRDSLPGVGFFRDIAIDDSGYVFVAGGASSTVYRRIYRFKLGATGLTVLDSVELPDNVTHIVIYSGSNLTTNVDDILYARAIGANGGVFKVSFNPPSYERLFIPVASTSGSHAIAVDVVGNIYYANPSQEWVRMYAPPNGPNSFTTRAPDTLVVVSPGKAAKLVTLAEARKDDNNDYIPDYRVTGDTLLVYGVITSPNYTASAGATSYYIQDETAGLNVFRTGVVLNFDLGDYIMVIGKMDIFRGLTEIIPLTADTTSIKVLWKNHPLPTPRKLTVAEFLANFERYEGQLIRLDSLWKAATSPAWPASGADANMIFTSYARTETLTVRIDRDTDIDGQPEPRYPVSIIGIATQFTAGPTVYTGGYQISPRYYSTDFITVNLPPSAVTLVSPGDSAFVRILSTDTIRFVWNRARDGNVPEDTLTYIFWLAKDRNFTTASIIRRDTLVMDTLRLVRGSELFPHFTDTTLVLFWRVDVTDRKSPAVRSATYRLNLSRPVSVDIANQDIPTDYYLSQNYPNPFNPVTTIKFGLPEDTEVEISVYNILGQKVATLVNEFRRAGHYVVQFDGSNYASGTYFYVLKAGNRIIKNKMLLIK
ncbi:MAG: FlgD immunoglobulin-like domain containing protein [Candidatus Kryptonium sp.]|nr:T9SS type A sorting domain-containing protein [Candidatus Kryptonium sp.]MDW8109129.1 FlgD immunoglobulin-like domain containing protein [Candidatus Kryptonium sp.]